MRILPSCSLLIDDLPLRLRPWWLCLCATLLFTLVPPTLHAQEPPASAAEGGLTQEEMSNILRYLKQEKAAPGQGEAPPSTSPNAAPAAQPPTKPQAPATPTAKTNPIEEDDYFVIPPPTVAPPPHSETSQDPATIPVPTAQKPEPEAKPTPSPVAKPRIASPRKPSRPIQHSTRSASRKPAPKDGSALADLLQENPMPYVQPEAKPNPLQEKTAPVTPPAPPEAPKAPVTAAKTITLPDAKTPSKQEKTPPLSSKAKPPASKASPQTASKSLPKPAAQPASTSQGQPRPLTVTTRNSPSALPPEQAPAPLIAPPTTPASGGLPVPVIKPGQIEVLSTTQNPPATPKTLTLTAPTSQPKSQTPEPEMAGNKPATPYLYAPSITAEPQPPARIMTPPTVESLQPNPHILQAPSSDSLPPAPEPDIVHADEALREAEAQKQPLPSLLSTEEPLLRPLHSDASTQPVPSHTKNAGEMRNNHFVTRAVFAKQIYNRNPAEIVTRISRFSRGLNYYTSLRNLRNHTVYHVWEHNGQEINRRDIRVLADNWRTWSWLSIKPEYRGTIIAKVVDSAGNVLSEQHLQVE